MVYEELIRAALARGRTYEELGGRLQATITPHEYAVAMRDFWIQRGAEWDACPASGACGEQEYYEELLRSYKGWYRLYPYHLAHYVCRILRVAPFKYYSDMLVAALVAEKPYHQIPNFTAADIVRVLGVGRNEYIAILNACKGRRVLWRLNRTSVARDLLPSEPRDPGGRLEPWWVVSVVNVGESEFRELGPQELAHLKTASGPGGGSHPGHAVRVADLQPDVLRGLLRRGLVYLEIPVSPSDRFSIPPLEGFVSNKDGAALPGGSTSVAAAVAAGADPMEALLYAIFVANSERMTVSELAAILAVTVEEVAAALSVASRLGFATRVYPPPDTALGGGWGAGGGGVDIFDGPLSRGAAGGSGELINFNDELPQQPTGMTGSATGGAEGDAAAAAAWLGGGGAAAGNGASGGAGAGAPLAAATAGGAGGGLVGRAVAVVLDAEATSFLMMGALSPGLKRHAVTLFEGGRVAGEALISEVTSELWASYAAGQGFEGDMARLTQFAAALATTLEVCREAGAAAAAAAAAAAGGAPGSLSLPGSPTLSSLSLTQSPPEALSLELLRKESLAGLPFAAAAKVLSTAYCALVPVTPLPPPPLPVPMGLPSSPAWFGPTRLAASPWLPLALYSAARLGPVSLVFAAGQRVQRLPAELESATHALLWPWDEDAAASRSKTSGVYGSAAHFGGEGGGPALVEGTLLLYALNEVLGHTAVMVQPLNAAPRPPPPTMSVTSGVSGVTGSVARSSAAQIHSGAGDAGGTNPRHSGSGGITGGLLPGLDALLEWAGPDLGSTPPGSGSTPLPPGGLSRVPGSLQASTLAAAEEGIDESSSGGTVSIPVSDAGVVDVPLPLPPSLLLQHLPHELLPLALRQQQQQQQTDQQGQGGSISGSGATHTPAKSSAAGSSQKLQWVVLSGIHRRGDVAADVLVPASLVTALAKLGLAGAVGFLRLARLPGSTTAPAPPAHLLTPPPSALQGGSQSQQPEAVGDTDTTEAAGAASEDGPVTSSATLAAAAGTGSTVAPKAPPTGGWLPLTVQLGIPLYCLSLCKAVCKAAREAGFLGAAGRAAQVAAQDQLQSQLVALTKIYSAPFMPPTSALPFATSKPLTGPDAVPGRPQAILGSAAGVYGTAPELEPMSAPADLPAANLLFNGADLMALQLSHGAGGVAAFW